MTQASVIRGRRKAKQRRPEASLGAALRHATAQGPDLSLAYPGYTEPDPEGGRRALVTGTVSALLHGLALAFLVFLASLAPEIEERLIAVSILNEEAPAPEEPAPAPKVLAERRNLPFAPAVQAIQPEIVNPRIIAEAAAPLKAEAFDMAAVAPIAAPTEIQQRSAVLDRVSAVDTQVRVQVGPVDVARVASPVVRGPTRVEGPLRPSVGPKKVTAAAIGTTVGTSPIQIGSGSSVQDGVISNRDVIGSPDGALIVSMDTSIGDGQFGGTGSGGTGSGSDVYGDGGDGNDPASQAACRKRPEVASYLNTIHDRTIQRWVLPPGVAAGLKVALSFQLDTAGSASSVKIVRADDNALGASAVDALRSAAPFPPMPPAARCLANASITGVFSNPVGG